MYRILKVINLFTIISVWWSAQLQTINVFLIEVASQIYNCLSSRYYSYYYFVIIIINSGKVKPLIKATCIEIATATLK